MSEFLALCRNFGPIRYQTSGSSKGLFAHGETRGSSNAYVCNTKRPWLLFSWNSALVFRPRTYQLKEHVPGIQFLNIGPTPNISKVTSLINFSQLPIDNFVSTLRILSLGQASGRRGPDGSGATLSGLSAGGPALMAHAPPQATCRRRFHELVYKWM